METVFSGSPVSYHCSLVCIQLSVYLPAGLQCSQADSYFTPTPATLALGPWPHDLLPPDTKLWNVWNLSPGTQAFLILDSFFIENLKKFCFLSQMKGFISCFSSCDRTSGFCKQRWGSEWWGCGHFLGSHRSLKSAWVLESERACSHHSVQHASSKTRASYLPSVRLHLFI